MNRKTGTFMVIAAVMFFAATLATCKKTGNGAVQGATPMAELLKAGKPPVALGSMMRGISPIAPTFNMTVTNVSDCPIKSLMGTVVYFDSDGKFIPGSPVDSGYAELTTIKPGEKIELSTMSNDENAATGKWILKEVIYMKMNPVDKLYGELPYKWTNPNYEAELAAATNK